MKDNYIYKVSVIIPVYGVEKYIERCAISLFEQTLESIEYIFINDCTPDKSIDILKGIVDQYPKRAPHVRILNMPRNSGQAAVRNFGISMVNGQYTIQCDSDDWVDVSMYEKMYEQAVMNDADVVVCDFYNANRMNNKPSKAFPLCRTDVPKKLIDWHCAGQLWNKMYRTSVYKNRAIILPQDNMGEDMAMVYQMAFFCKKVVYIPQCLYYFFSNPNSITHAHSDEKVLRHYLQTCKNASIVEQFYKQNGYYGEVSKYIELIKNDERNKILPLLKKDTKYYDLWKKTFPELNSAVLWKSHFKFKDKIKFLLIYFRLLP